MTVLEIKNQLLQWLFTIGHYWCTPISIDGKRPFEFSNQLMVIDDRMKAAPAHHLPIAPEPTIGVARDFGVRSV